MGNAAYDKIKRGLEEALAHARGEDTGARVTVFQIPDLDVADVRGKTGLSQGGFAATFGINVATLRNWEQKRSAPQGAARVLLTVIDRDPMAVLRALRVTSPKHAKKAPAASSARGRGRAAG